MPRQWVKFTVPTPGGVLGGVAFSAGEDYVTWSEFSASFAYNVSAGVEALGHTFPPALVSMSQAFSGGQSEAWWFDRIVRAYQDGTLISPTEGTVPGMPTAPGTPTVPGPVIVSPVMPQPAPPPVDAPPFVTPVAEPGPIEDDPTMPGYIPPWSEGGPGWTPPQIGPWQPPTIPPFWEQIPELPLPAPWGGGWPEWMRPGDFLGLGALRDVLMLVVVASAVRRRRE